MKYKLLFIASWYKQNTSIGGFFYDHSICFHRNGHEVKFIYPEYVTLFFAITNIFNFSLDFKKNKQSFKLLKTDRYSRLFI
jgi:hypothetical protein